MRWFVPVAVALGALAPKLALGADKPRVRIEASDALEGEQTRRFVSAIASQVSDVAEVVSAPGSSGVVVRLEKTGSDVTLTFVDDAGRALARPRVVSGDDEVAASSAGAIVRAYVVAATAEPPPPSVPERAPPPPEPRSSPPPSAAPPPRRDTLPPPLHLAAGTIRFGAYYTGTTFAPELPWQSGARLEGSVRFARLGYAGLGYAFCPGVTLSQSGVDVRVTRHFVGAFVGLESTGRTFAAAVDVSAGVDATLRATTNVANGLSATSGATHPSPVLALRAHGRIRAPEGTGLSLDVAPAFEASPGGRALVIDDGATTLLLAPSEARFRLDVGGTFDGF